jgi:methylthioribose-1-phosphate isomerase
MSVLEAIRYTHAPTEKPKLVILDQLQLPHTSHYDEITGTKDGWDAIKTMRTRGAPAIAIVAALSLAVELGSALTISQGQAAVASEFVKEKLRYLVTSRPTAVNLEDAARKLSKVVDEAAKGDKTTGQAVVDAYTAAAEKMLENDVSDNKAIGKYGAEWIVKNAPKAKDGKVKVITHCNTGYLSLSPPEKLC